jgi:hypothetical protein
MAFAEFDVVVTTVGFQSEEIPPGRVGTVVHVFSQPSESYLVEFANEAGETLAMVTALPNQIALADLLKAA